MGFDRDTFWATPPRGITKSTVRIGPDVRHHYTYFCDANTECMAVAYGSTEESARRELNDHICPAEVKSEMMPSGKTVIQKMWDELDYVINVIKSDETPEEDKAAWKRSAEAFALCIAFVSIPYFRSRVDILKQANKRWRIRQGEIPWEATPGYNYYPLATLAYAKPEPEVKRTPLKASKPAKKVDAPVVVKVRDFSVAERTMIQDGIHKQGMRAEDLASMFGVSVDRIKTIAGSTPTEDDEAMFPIAMF